MKPQLLSKASSVTIVRQSCGLAPVAENVEFDTAVGTESSSVSLDISLRRGRIALVTIVSVTLIFALMSFFQHGYEIRQYEKTTLDVAQQKRILDDYNSYSGGIVSVFSKPIEIFIAACVQVILLRFVSASLLRNEPSWKAVYGVLALSASVSYLINNGFISLNVQLVDQKIKFAIKTSDLSASDSTTVTYSDGVTNVSWSVSESQPRNPTTNTVLHNVVQSPAVRPTSACDLSGYNRFTKPIALDNVEYGFAQRDWMKQLLPEALPATSLRLLVNPTNKSANAGAQSEKLPMNASIASNLVLHAMILSSDFIPMSGALRDDAYDAQGGTEANISTAVHAGLLPPKYESTSDAKQKKWFLNGVSSFLTTAFNSTKNMTLTNIPMEFSHVDIAPYISFDAVTLEFTVEPKLYADETNNKTGERYMTEGTEYSFFTDNSMTCGPWPARCLFKKKDPSTTSLMNTASDLYYDSPAQIQAFSICLNENGTELIQSTGPTSTLNVLPCERTSTSSMLVVSVGKRLVADALSVNSTVNETGAYPAKYGGSASATNVRKIYSYTVGRLSWATTDIAEEFGAKCDITSDNKCQGLSIELNATSAGSSPQRLVVGVDAIPTQSLVQPRLNNLDLDSNYRQRPLTLVQVREPTKQLHPESWYDAVAGDILLPHNVRNITWDQRKTYVTSMCDVTEERIQRVLDNHMYIEHPLQATYTAATFFLFQNAMVKDVITSNGDIHVEDPLEATYAAVWSFLFQDADAKDVVASNETSSLDKIKLAFDGNTQKVSLTASIPSTNALMTQIGCVVLLFSVAVSIAWATIVHNSKTRTNSLAGITNAEILMRAKLDEKTFPSLLLHRHVTFKNDTTGERRTLDGFVINSLSLQHRDERRENAASEGDVGVKV